MSGDPRDSRRWRRVRVTVLLRDGYRCRYCGGYATTVDHVRSLADGGAAFDLSNLVAACVSCNCRRGLEVATRRALRTRGTFGIENKKKTARNSGTTAQKKFRENISREKNAAEFLRWRKSSAGTSGRFPPQTTETATISAKKADSLPNTAVTADSRHVWPGAFGQEGRTA